MLILRSRWPWLWVWLTLCWAVLVLYCPAAGTCFWWAFPHPGMTPLGNTIAGFAYLPLVAWGPLLAAVTIAHQRRHRVAGA